MGFFPFMAPFSPWIKQVMEDREADTKQSILQKNPFAILTSAALVVKGGSDVFESDIQKRKESVKKLIKDPPAGESYKGCIIASNINDLSLSYSTNKTPVGIDFTGKVIEVENETGRKVSTPIIESIDIDTDGANNTLKTAKVNIRCFTLKQLEMFELFFMKPGMSVLLEFGDSTLKHISGFNKTAQPGQPVQGGKIYEAYQNGELKSLDTYPNIEEALVRKIDYNKFCKEEFYKYFRSDTTGQQDYIKRVEQSLGSFDLVAGKVTDYNFSIDPDGTYTVDLEISQGNQISLAIPHSKPTQESKTATQAKNIEFTPTDQIIELIATDFNLDINAFISMIGKDGKGTAGFTPEHGGGWDLDWFNFLKVNKEQQDTIASADAYVSLRFILKILMNYILADGNIDNSFFKLEIPKFFVPSDNKEIEIIPVTSHAAMLSSSDQLIFPRNNIPQIIGPIPPKKGSKTKKNEANIETYNKNSNIDGRIGKKLDFHFDKNLQLPNDRKEVVEKDFKDNKDLKIGNALNIFVKYETVVKYWKSTYTRMDFLEKILNVVNQNGYGLYNLIFGVTNENGKPSVFDYRFAPQTIINQSEKESYRFKPTTIKSIVKEFSFNFELSNLVAGRTIFNSGKFLALAKEEQKNRQTGELELPAAAYKSIDNSTFGNADGWYSINNVELERIKENFQKAKEGEEKKVKVQTADTAKPEDTTKEAQEISEVIKGKSVNFLIDEDSAKGRKVVLIYKDSAFIRNQINQKESDTNKPTVSPVTVTITLDGFSGFRCGQYFNVDGIPEIYNQIGVFQITNTKHNVSKDGWTTTIEADHRIINKIKKA